MATLIKKGRKGGQSGSEANGEAPAMALPETTSEMSEAPPDEQPAYTPPPSGYAAARRNEYDTPAPEPYRAAAEYTPPTGADDFQLPNRYIPAEPPPSAEPPSPRGGGLLNRVLLFSGETTAADRDRVAQEEFERAIAPVMEYMRAAVPDASSPEEAARIWSQNQGEITPDPNGGSYVYGDAFDNDARVYYRLLRRDYEKNPRPSEKKKVSHHLHGIYNKLPGTRGW